MKYPVRATSGRLNVAVCVCPDCGQRHTKQVEVEFISDRDVVRLNGLLPIVCYPCWLKTRAGRLSKKNTEEE